VNKSTPIKIFARPGAAALLVVLLGAMLSACSPDGADSARDDDGQSSPAAGSASAGERPGAASRDQRVQAASAAALDAAGLLGRWTLVKIDGEPIQERYRGQAASLEFLEDGAVSGYAGVNRIRLQASGDLAQGQIKFKQGLSTMMAGPPKAMEFEREFTARLDSASGFQVRENLLQIWSGDEPVLELERSGT
jgi:heat shock protein HslJ